MNLFIEATFQMHCLTISMTSRNLEALEKKYTIERQHMDKFLIMKYFEFTLINKISIMDHVHELQILINRLRDLKIIIPKLLQVEAIIMKLPPTWNDYRKKLLYMAEDFTTVHIFKHLKIEKESRKRDVVHLNSNMNTVSKNGSNKIQNHKYQNSLRVQKNKFWFQQE